MSETSQALPPGPPLNSWLQTAVMLPFAPRLLAACRRRYGSTFTLRANGVDTLVYVTDPADIKTAFAGDPAVYHAGEANVILRGLLGDSSVLLIDEDTDRDRRRLMWSIRSRGATACEGIASFVATPASGFALYLGLTPPVRDRNVLSRLCSRIEKQMILDAPGAHGWYVQCAGALERDILLSPGVGFHELDVPFTRISGSAADTVAAGEPAHLLYKPFGRVHQPPQIPVREFLTSMRQILMLVDGAGDSNDGDRYSRLERQMSGRDTVPVKP
jgi:hypothetical protein